MDSGYFDITHSFKIDSSTYHVLGLRKERPTYGNNYYIFHCGCDRPQSARYASVSLPRIRSNETHTVYESNATHEQEKSFQRNRGRTPTGPQKKTSNDIEDIKKTLTELMKSEHETLVASLRKDIHAEQTTILRSIEKESEVFTEVTSSARTDKQELHRLLERHKTSIESTLDRDVKEILSAIDSLKKTLSQTLRTQNEQLQSLNEFQATFSETIERQIEKAMVKQFESQRSTSLEATAIKQIQSTIVDTLEKRSTTTKDDEDSEAIKRLLNDQKQQLTDLLMKQQRTYATSIEEMKKLQTSILDGMKEPTKDTQSFKSLLDEQTKQLTDVITKQQSSLSLNQFKEAMSSAFSEHFATNSRSGMRPDPRPFKLSIKSGEFAHVFARLYIDGHEYPKEIHTLCQRDPLEENVVDCFVAPPIQNGPCELIIYAKTSEETEYQATLCVQLSYVNIPPSNIFPQVYPSFKDNQCVLLEPLRRFLRKEEEILLHMIVPDARSVSIRNGDDDIELDGNEYQDGVLKKKMQVQGNLSVYGQWNENELSPICAFQIE